MLISVFIEYQSFKLEYRRHSLTELKKMLSVDVETPVLISLEEDWWLHVGLYLVCVGPLEQFNRDSSNTNSLLSTEVETFTQFSIHQLESKYLLQNKSVVKGKDRYRESERKG